MVAAISSTASNSTASNRMASRARGRAVGGGRLAPMGWTAIESLPAWEPLRLSGGVARGVAWRGMARGGGGGAGAVPTSVAVPSAAVVPARRSAVRLHSPAARQPASTYRRRRAVAAGLVLALVLVVWAALSALGGDALPVSERVPGLHPGEVYVVQPGDTLWSIAQRLKPHGDPRPVVDRLVAAHGGATIHIGERLPLPS